MIIRKYNTQNIKNTLFNLLKYGEVKLYAVGSNPLHVHILFKPKSFIPFGLFSGNGVYTKFIRIKSRRHYFNVINYINGHKIRGGGEMKKEEFVRFVVDGLNELREKVGKLEEEIRELKQSKTETQGQSDSVEVNLSRMNIRLQQGRKGVAMRIRFARYVKPNNRGEFYVILTKDDIKSLMTALQSIKIPTGSDKNSNVKTETADKAF